MYVRNIFKIYQKYQESIKLIIIIFFLIGSYFGYQWYIKNFSIILRTIFIIFSIILILTIFKFTNINKKIFLLLYESKLELNKIIWPNNKETFYTTIIISIITILVSLILWILDSILFKIISNIIHLRL